MSGRRRRRRRRRRFMQPFARQSHRLTAALCEETQSQNFSTAIHF
jgi:hypothetical protein